MEDFFKDTTKIYRTIGFQLSYEKTTRGFLMRFLAVYSYFAIIIGWIYHGFYYTLEKMGIDEMIETLTNSMSMVESLVMMATYQYKAKELSYLIYEIEKNLREGLRLRPINGVKV